MLLLRSVLSQMKMKVLDCDFWTWWTVNWRKWPLVESHQNDRLICRFLRIVSLAKFLLVKRQIKMCFVVGLIDCCFGCFGNRIVFFKKKTKWQNFYSLNVGDGIDLKKYSEGIKSIAFKAIEVCEIWFFSVYLVIYFWKKDCKTFLLLRDLPKLKLIANAQRRNEVIVDNEQQQTEIKLFTARLTSKCKNYDFFFVFSLFCSFVFL